MLHAPPWRIRIKPPRLLSSRDVLTLMVATPLAFSASVAFSASASEPQYIKTPSGADHSVFSGRGAYALLIQNYVSKRPFFAILK